MSWHRLRTDFRFAITTLFGVVTMLFVLPFAIYRFTQGQVWVGLVDLGIVASILVGVAHAWRGGDIDRVASGVVVACCIGCVLVANLVGLPGLVWMYPVLLANFMLVGWRMAIAVSVLALVGILLSPGLFESRLQVLMFLVTGMVTGLFAFIFAYRTESQRQQLEALASHDPLTGAFNRRALQRELVIAIESARRHRIPYGLALLDLDHFKQINDNHGHEAGDQVLVDFTGLVRLHSRRGDRLFRYGGEEFVLLLPHAGRDALPALCGHLRARVAAELAAGDAPITVSIGAAALEPDETAAGWLARADAAMYEAKRRGRDRVVVHAGGAAAETEPAA